jgi:hypothetical protein
MFAALTSFLICSGVIVPSALRAGPYAPARSATARVQLCASV